MNILAILFAICLGILGIVLILLVAVSMELSCYRKGNNRKQVTFPTKNKKKQ